MALFFIIFFITPGVWVYHTPMHKSPEHAPWVHKACRLLTLVFGMVYLSQFINYQAFLSTGDHGLNLYAAKAVLEGQRPYHDFHWFYGPLMLYYYAFCFKIFGVGLQSVLLGAVILKLLSGLLMFSICALYISPLLALCAAVWFWLFNFDFFYTYNNTGGITLGLFILYVLFLYFKTGLVRNLIWGSLACVALGMIKLNQGFCGIFCLNAGVMFHQWATHQKFPGSLRKYLITSSLVVPVFLIAANWLYVFGLPFYIIRQCFQYFGNDTQAWEYSSPLQVLAKMKDYLINRIRPHKDITAVTLFAGMSLIFLLYLKIKPVKKTERPGGNLVPISCLLLFVLAFAHEFWLSGVIFRSFWAQPFLFLLLFFSIGLAANRAHPRFQVILFLILIVLLGTRCVQKTNLIRSFKNQNQYLALDKARIYVGNPFDWIYTVTNTTRYLEKHMGTGESVFVLPYDPLYYFLLDRHSPTRQLAIVRFADIPPVQEQSIVAELEKTRPRWVILSNRSAVDNKGTGHLGVTYGLLVDQYIRENYTLQKEIGNWAGVAGWTNNHATKIFVRGHIP